MRLPAYHGTMQDGNEHDTTVSPSAQRVVDGLRTFDGKVDAMRERRANDPDSLGDKIIKVAVPAIAGFAAGHLFQLIWNAGTRRHDVDKATGLPRPQGFAMELLFAACSAAFGAVVSQLSDRGSQAFVNHRHRKSRH